MKCAAKTASTPAAPQNKKKVAAVPNKKDLIPDSVLGDVGRMTMLPLVSDNSDLYEGGEDGAVEQKQDTKMNHGSLVNCQSSIQFILLPQVAHKHHLIQKLHSPLIISIWESASEGPGFF